MINSRIEKLMESIFISKNGAVITSGDDGDSMACCKQCHAPIKKSRLVNGLCIHCDSPGEEELDDINFAITAMPKFFK